MRKPISLLAVTAAFVLILTACSKKEEPNVTNETENMGSSNASSGTNSSPSGSGTVGETDINSANSTASSRSGLSGGMLTVMFEYDSAILSDAAKSTIRENADNLKKNQMAIVLEGHCDERGSDEYNLALGERRANSVRDYLVNMGLSKTRVKTISYGEEKPAVPGSSESAFAQNRRVEFASTSR